MKLLLDTHAFLWLNTEPARLPSTTLVACESPNNQLYLSVASAWEIQIKSQLKRLTLPVPLAKMIEVQQEANGLQLLPIVLDHVTELSALAPHHGDPFDRLLIAQARVEQLSLVSHDRAFKAYLVDILW